MGKFERVFRIVFLVLMLVVSCMSTSRDSYVPLCNNLLLVAAMSLTGELSFVYFPYTIALPTLFLFNVWLLLWPSRTVRILYMISMVFFVSFKWSLWIEWGFRPSHLLSVAEILVLFTSPFAAEVLVISIGALFEVVIVLVALFGKRIQQAGR